MNPRTRIEFVSPPNLTGKKGWTISCSGERWKCSIDGSPTEMTFHRSEFIDLTPVSEAAEEEAESSTGWITNPDRVPMPNGGVTFFHPRPVFSLACDFGESDDFAVIKCEVGKMDCGYTIIEQQTRQKRDYAAIVKLEEAKQSGTLPGILHKAHSDYVTLLDQPVSWASLMDEVKELRAQVASEQSERVRLTNLVIALGGEA